MENNYQYALYSFATMMWIKIGTVTCVVRILEITFQHITHFLNLSETKF